MNERIRELADKIWAEEYWDNPATDKLLPAQLNKFAELIVGECAQAFEAEVDTWKEMDPYQGSMKRKGTQAIKKHFGVEE
jgi:hypothetical protein